MVFIFLAYFTLYNGKIWNALRICVSSLHRGHANLLCIVPILVYVLPKRAHKRAKTLKVQPYPTVGKDMEEPVSHC